MSEQIIARCVPPSLSILKRPRLRTRTMAYDVAAPPADIEMELFVGKSYSGLLPPFLEVEK